MVLDNDFSRRRSPGLIFRDGDRLLESPEDIVAGFLMFALGWWLGVLRAVAVASSIWGGMGEVGTLLVPGFDSGTSCCKRTSSAFNFLISISLSFNESSRSDRAVYRSRKSELDELASTRDILS
jgi:hypothetical protein